MPEQPQSGADEAEQPTSMWIDPDTFDGGLDEGSAPNLDIADKNERADAEVNNRAPTQRIAWMSLCAFGVVPVIAVLLALGAGFAKWQDVTARDIALVRIQTVQVAKDSTVALLSYHRDTVEKDLAAARDRLTGEFRDSYTSLTNDVVIPGAKQKQISAVATVPAAASVSANANHAEVLVFVNQQTTVGNDAPTDTASTVKVALDHIDGRWLISAFDPI